MAWSPDIDAGVESLPVLLKRGAFHDESRSRSIPYKLYHPAVEAGLKTPLIIWSHGYGGNRDGAGFLSRFIASHGYALLHITHTGTDSSLWEGKPGHPWDILKAIKITPQASIERFRDVPFVLDQMRAGNFEHPEILPMIDGTKAGMSGHSFGALTAQVMAGQRFPDAHGNLQQMKDERFTAAIAYSPMPMHHISDASPEDLYGDITLPLFSMTGTDDSSPIEGFDYTKRLAVYEHAHAADKYLMILQDGDHMVYNGTRGQLGKNPHQSAHEDAIKLASLAFWNAYLKDDEKALAWLQGPSMKSFIGDGVYKHELPNGIKPDV